MKKLSIILIAAAFSLFMSGCVSQSGIVPQEDKSALDASQGSDTVDKSDLQEELDSQGQHNEGDYPKEAWDQYMSAVENAQAVLEDSEANQEDVDSAKASLRNSEYSLKNATSQDHPKRFDYEWYKDGNFHARDGAWVTAACMVSMAFEDSGKLYLVATIANDDATLSPHDVLLQATSEASLEGYKIGSALAILGTTEEMQHVEIGSYSEYLPTINVVEILEAP